MRKTRPDSVLKNLPEDQQKAIVEFAKGHTVARTVEYCNELGVTTSRSAVSRFLGDWYVTRDLEEARDFADRLREDLENVPQLKGHDDSIMRIAQRHFELQAMKNRDAKLFMGLRRWSVAERNLDLEIQKYRDSLKSDLEKALDAFAEEVRGNVEAEALVKKLQALMVKTVEAAA